MVVPGWLIGQFDYHSMEEELTPNYSLSTQDDQNSDLQDEARETLTMPITMTMHLTIERIDK